MLLREGDTWKLLGTVADYALIPGAEARAGEAQTESPLAVWGELARCLTDPVSCAAVRTMLEDFGAILPGPRDPWRGHEERAELGRHLERALERGLVVIVQVARPTIASDAAERQSQEPAPPAKTTVSEAEKTWIAIELVDRHDPPRPVPYARYRLTLPDGSIREGRLDHVGLAWVEGIDPGLCEVTFPEIDGREWR